MTPPVPDDDPRPEDGDGAETGQALDGSEGQEDAPQSPRRGRRQGLIKKKREELVPWMTHFAGQLGNAREVVIRGSGISSLRAELDKLADALGHLASMLKQAGAEPMVGPEGVSLGRSAHVHLIPTPEELRRVEQAVGEAESLRKVAEAQEESGNTRGARATEKTIQRVLQASVPAIDVALALTGELIEAPVDEAPLRVAEFGQTAADTYKSLVTTLSKAGLTLELPVADIESTVPQSSRTARLTYGRAALVADVLREPSETRRERIEVVGTLSLADSKKKLFRLDLSKETPLPESIKRKRAILGRYAPAVEALIGEGGLWNARVLASIEIERDAVLSTARTRPPLYELVGVVAADE